MKKLPAAILLASALAASAPAHPQMTTKSLRGHDGLELEHNLVLPQIVVGENYSTSIVLLNLGDSERMEWMTGSSLQTTGKISFYRRDGRKLAVGINGGSPASELRFTLDPSGSAYYQLAAQGAETSGWALIEVDDDDSWGRIDGHEMTRGGRVMATAFYTLESGGSVVSRAAVVPSLYERSRYFSSVIAAQQETDLYTGVAIVNTGAASAPITLRLKDADGKLVATATIDLAAGNQTARFLHELFGSAVSERFQGTLETSTNAEGVVVLGLLVSQGVMTSIPTFHFGTMARM